MYGLPISFEISFKLKIAFITGIEAVSIDLKSLIRFHFCT
jgi:hypothetical protein